MARRRSRQSGLTDLLNRLPGRPWWWGVGLVVVLLLFVIVTLRGCGVGGAVRGIPTGAEGNDPSPVKKPEEKKLVQPASAPSPVLAAASQGPADVQKVSAVAMPALLSQWSDEDFLHARAQGDPRLPAAVEQHVKASQAALRRRKCWFRS